MEQEPLFEMEISPEERRRIAGQRLGELSVMLNVLMPQYNEAILENIRANADLRGMNHLVQ